MMTPGYYSVATGWYGHRVGDAAMTGAWSISENAGEMQLTDASAEVACVLGRDSRSAAHDVALPRSVFWTREEDAACVSRTALATENRAAQPSAYGSNGLAHRIASLNHSS